MKILQAFIENSPDSISVYNKKLHLVAINTAGLDLIQKTRSQSIGQFIKTLAPDVEKSGLLKEYKEVIKNGKPFISEDVSNPRQIGNKQFSVRAFNTEEGLAIVTRDITALKKTERLLIRANKRLEELNYIAAHDMKAPLTNVLSLTKLIDESGVIKENCQELFDKLITSIKRMQHTIHTLNDVMAIQEDLLPIDEELPFTEVLNSVKNNIATQIIEAKVTIRADFTKAPYINYPQFHLQSILQNLISNAIKYRHPNKEALIEIETMKKDEGWYLFIKDNGLGMDLNSSKDSIFRLFKRMHTHVEGSGVGLYIVHSLVESHGGTIEVTSEINKGTTFKIYLGYE
ncbi:MAG: signal transduction histidine kinase [Nonlabens sp.]|jgi:signal transduction histidine kinase|uniref:PAS domain-containing sensor histidine kinase n=1 Tax=Nonlabens sp. TaxID=1888209 RepID=UPI0039E4C090